MTSLQLFALVVDAAYAETFCRSRRNNFDGAARGAKLTSVEDGGGAWSIRPEYCLHVQVFVTIELCIVITARFKSKAVGIGTRFKPMSRFR